MTALWNSGNPLLRPSKKSSKSGNAKSNRLVLGYGIWESFVKMETISSKIFRKYGLEVKRGVVSHKDDLSSVGLLRLLGTSQYLSICLYNS